MRYSLDSRNELIYLCGNFDILLFQFYRLIRCGWGCGWGFKTGFPVGEGERKKLVQYCNQWPAMLDFESRLSGIEILFLCKRFICRPM